jgi:uncharacterized protein YvpB
VVLDLSSLVKKRSRRNLVREALALAAVAPLARAGLRPSSARAQEGGVTLPDGRYYDAYIPTTTKEGQFYHYTCEFDAAWVVLSTFGYDVGFEEQLSIVGHDTSIEPYHEETPDGFFIYGGDILESYSGDYYENFLARCTGNAMMPLFAEYNLEAYPVHDRASIEQTLDQGGLVWTKATADFLPWADTIWVTPDGQQLPTVLGNDHAVVVMGYNDNGVVIRDVLGPTNTNWERAYEYDVPWVTFLAVFEAQGSDGVAVFPPDDESAAPLRTIKPAG